MRAAEAKRAPHWILRTGGPMAKWLIVAGIVLLLIGAALQFAPWLFAWFGKLPGDINVESGSVKIFVPITSMLLLSIALTLILNILNR